MSIEKTDGEPPFRNPDLPLHQWQPAVPRLGLAAFRTGTEVRGFHHKDPVAHGLNVWAPVVNPLRDRRWGRNEEGYSEDLGSWRDVCVPMTRIQGVHDIVAVFSAPGIRPAELDLGGRA